MASILKECYKPWVGSARQIGLTSAIISTMFVFTGTACLAESNAFQRYHGPSLAHWQSGYHHYVKPQKHEHYSFIKNRHLRRHKHKFSSFGVLGGYYGRSDSYDNIQINLVLPPNRQDENPETMKKAREPLPPHIETLTDGNESTASSYQTVNSGNTAAHIVEYRAHGQ